MASSRFQLISKKFVKPFFPTPPSLRNYRLSLIDQLITDSYMPMALFYPNQHHKLPNNTSEISSLLEESLSKTLSSYYPFAGRRTDNISVNCNDMGATFLEARIRCPMSEILKEANTSAQDIIFPSGLPWSTVSDQTSLVVAQLNHFDCGGKALSVCMSHKIGDGPTLCNFINDWAAMAHQPSKKPSPQFIGESILPPNDLLIEPVSKLKQEQNCITRRFVFDSYRLGQLKAKAAAESGVQNPSRFEVVCALLYKCAMSASIVYSGSFKPSLFGSMSNLRPLIGAPVTQNYVGNLLSYFYLLTTDEIEINFSRLVKKIRGEKILHYEKFKGITTNELLSASHEKAEQLKVLQENNDIDIYGFSSLCRYPTYNIDFGWGRPIRVSLATFIENNFCVLIDSPNLDGVEVLFSLDDQVMSTFQDDPELLAFVSTDSSF